MYELILSLVVKHNPPVLINCWQWSEDRRVGNSILSRQPTAETMFHRTGKCSDIWIRGETILIVFFLSYSYSTKRFNQFVNVIVSIIL